MPSNSAEWKKKKAAFGLPFCVETGVSEIALQEIVLRRKAIAAVPIHRARAAKGRQREYIGEIGDAIGAAVGAGAFGHEIEKKRAEDAPFFLRDQDLPGLLPAQKTAKLLHKAIVPGRIGLRLVINPAILQRMLPFHFSQLHIILRQSETILYHKNLPNE